MIVILTALEVEYQAVRKHLRNLVPHHHPAGTIVEVGHLRDAPHAQVALAGIGMGTANAATLTERVIAEFAPRAVFFVGIAGGLRDWLALGDIVVGTRIYAYQGGRIDQDEFQARPRAWDASHRLLELAKLVGRTKAWPGAKKSTSSVHFEPIAAGDVVLNSTTAPENDRLRRHFNDAAVVETESSGVALAAHLSESTPVIAVRGISDHAGGGAGKYAEDAAGSQPKAAANAAAFAIGLTAAVYQHTNAARRPSAATPDTVYNTGAYVGPVHATGRVRIDQKVINYARNHRGPVAGALAVVLSLLLWGTYSLINANTSEGDDPSSSTASNVAGLLAVGDESACGLRTDHTVVCWGDGGDYLRPAGRFTAVTTRKKVACGLREDGTATCWDSTGAHTSTGPSPTPRAPKDILQPRSADRFSSITVGCGVLRTGKVTCWDEDMGYDRDGAAPPGTFTAITASMYEGMCGIRTDSTVLCWSQDELTPPSGTFRMVSMGGYHACGLRTDETVTCWGRNNRGQTVAPDGEFLSVSAGEEHSCGLRTDRTITCWGNPKEGATAPPKGEFAVLGHNTGGEFSCATRPDGKVECWGQSGDVEVPAERLLVRS